MNDLRRLAEAAIPGPWVDPAYLRCFINEDDEQIFADSDIDLIAACTPEVIIALLDVYEEAATVAGLDSSFNDDGTPGYPALTAALDRLDEVTK